MSYAGDVAAKDVWSALQGDPGSQLVDVRTAAEWGFVGVPDLSSAGRAVILVEWQGFPGMERNAAFQVEAAGRLAAVGAGRDAAIYFLCRSGARSRAAAVAMTAAGFERCYNVAEGFEGDLDAKRHRGQSSGWKACGLPWVQT